MKCIVLMWAAAAAVFAVTSASLMRRTEDHPIELELKQYTDTWIVQLSQSQSYVEADALAKKHGLINQGKVQLDFVARFLQ